MGNPIYMEELKKDSVRYQKFLHYQELGLITEFDSEVLSRLRNIYWGQFFPAILYIYFMKTDFETIGNKVELLCQAFINEEFRICHALTKTVQGIPFYQYDHQHLDYNSYVEKISGHNAWVYDPFALLRFDKEVYQEIECPRSRLDQMSCEEAITCIDFVGKEQLMQIQKVLEIDDSYEFHLYQEFVLLIEELEKRLDNHPYRELLEKEIGILKEKHDIGKLKKLIANERNLNNFFDQM